VVATFLDSHDDFSLDDLTSELPAFAPGGLAADGSAGADKAGTVLTLPHRDHTAGFFIARLRRS
jgi:16S rRNA C967 or C1407 C5-methylase (RsmB/RsmF family)